MKPIYFNEVNVEFAKDQTEYNTLPAFKENSPKGEVITCWKLSFKERLYLMFFGEIWLSLLSFNKPLTPSFMSVNKTDVLIVKENKIRTILKKVL